MVSALRLGAHLTSVLCKVAPGQEHQDRLRRLGVVVHACNPRHAEAEVGGFQLRSFPWLQW
jgi:hypothetical protein